MRPNVVTIDPCDGLGYVEFDVECRDWTDAHIPRTSSPVYFVPRVVESFGLRLGMVHKFARVSPSRIVSGLTPYPSEPSPRP